MSFYYFIESWRGAGEGGREHETIGEERWECSGARGEAEGQNLAAPAQIQDCWG